MIPISLNPKLSKAKEPVDGKPPERVRSQGSSEVKACFGFREYRVWGISGLGFREYRA